LLTDARGQAGDARAQLADVRSRNASERRQISHLRGQMKRLTAVGRLPDLTGEDVADAQDSQLVSDFEWKVRTVHVPSSRPVGTVISQSPAAGTNLKRGADVTLSVAAPMPKQWVTVASFSGAGSGRTATFQVPTGAKVRAHYVFNGDTNAILELKQPGDGEFGGDLLLNEIGNYDQSTRLYDLHGHYYFDIQGGTWTVQVQVFK
jgi:hypothetical protein